MISGIVYFEEILAGIKDETGVEALESQYPKIGRLMMRCEKDIGSGGLIVRKTKTYNLGDSDYDGRYMLLPKDMTSESSYGEINTANFRGDRLELVTYPGPDTIDFSYMGYLADTNGNPITTHNHMDAVIAFCVWKLYMPRVFLGLAGTSMAQGREYKQDYNDLCMASRGNDAFPTEAEWEEIGQILRQPFSEVMAQSGIVYVDNGITSTQSIEGDMESLEIDMVAVYEVAKAD